VKHGAGTPIVARHVGQLFERLPMLSGFWLRPDRFLAEPVCRPARTGDLLALSALLRPTDRRARCCNAGRS
jgi:hypothetical protein